MFYVREKQPDNPRERLIERYYASPKITETRCAPLLLSTKRLSEAAMYRNPSAACCNAHWQFLIWL
jgi:hypothetical protein